VATADTYSPVLRVPKARIAPKTTDSGSREETPQTSRLEASSRPEAQLDLKEIQQLTFKALKAAWGARDGEANYDASYDFDKNGVINMFDWIGFSKELASSFEAFKQAYGSKVGEGSYRSTYDYDDDGAINMFDWIAFRNQWVG
jgi:hypothetical protein